MKQIYNEGRVIGLSSWELYLRQMLATNPNAIPLSEREWLSSTISPNMAMVLKVARGTTAGIHDYLLPSNSDLCACSTLYACIFEGSATMLPNSYWAKEIDDYGPLISNTNSLHPSTPGQPGNVPVVPASDPRQEQYDKQNTEYLKITNGLFIQPGTWTSNIYDTEWLIENGVDCILTEQGDEILVPMQDHIAGCNFTPDLSKPGFLRLSISANIEEDVYVYISGFSYKSIVYGTVSYEHVEEGDHPENGDFLGPCKFPWACKVMMSATSQVAQYIVAEFEALKRYVEAAVGDLPIEIEELFRRLEEIVREIQGIPEQVASLTQQVNEFNTLITALEQRVTALENKTIISASEGVVRFGAPLS